MLFYKPFYYLRNPIEVFYTLDGGMSFHGGFLGVVFVVFSIGIVSDSIFAAPVPEKPGTHAHDQLDAPIGIHVAFASQSSSPALHASASWQVTPLKL